tara:strand:+ start:5234 stop:6523 length:1290 start_codon:yes stop_codon:yes gene_type:complete
MKNKFINTCIELSKIYRTITGVGISEVLALIKKKVGRIKIISFKSGTKVFDWTIPNEWNVRDAYIADSKGKKIIDFKNHPLHLMPYSIPVDKNISKKELISKIYTNKKLTNAIPYVTGYYANDWAFCDKYSNVEKIKKLNTNKFYVKIDSFFNPKGFLKLGEVYIKGKSKKEILFSTYICHPFMANNESSGPTLAMGLVNYINKNVKNNYFSYRFLFLPETIGSIAYLSKNYKKMKKNIFAGYVLTCVGDDENFSLIMTPSENSISDISIKASLQHEKNVKFYSFLNRGSDERQFCSPNIDLPIATFCRSKFGTYPEYHTSLDNHKLVSERGFQRSFDVFKNIIISFENSLYPKSNFFGEPMMSKRKLYPKINLKSHNIKERKFLDVLAYCNGERNIFDISLITKINLKNINKIIFTLKENKLISIIKK